MWGLATTLYSLLTGHHPDKIGRSNFRWPPQGEASLSPEDRSNWERWHAAILRATEESPHERFLTIQFFADACQSGSEAGEMSQPDGVPQKRFGVLAGIAILILGLAAWLIFWSGLNRNPVNPSQTGTGANVQPLVLQPNGEEPASAQQNSAEQIQEVPAPEIDFSGVVKGMEGSLNAVEKLGVETEQLRQNLNRSKE